MWSGIGKTPPPWKSIEFFKSPIFFQFPYSVCEVEWVDKTPEIILSLKNKIGEKEGEPEWDLAKRITNPYELIFTSSNHVNLPQSISLLKPLSRSFFKLVEILELLRFFETTKAIKYRSLHLCEGPGGFIEAFLDRAAKNRKTVSHAYAMTLKQTNHTIPGWRAATRLLSRHPEILIVYGPNSTGNILEENNQKYLETLLKNKVHLVTADGGFDFSIDFQAQEKLVFPLLVASAKIALSCLAQNGTFILKIFDSFSDTTVNFLSFLSLHFQEYTIYKPATSRPCNSERYFIGRYFRNFPESSRAIFDIFETNIALNTEIVHDKMEEIKRNLNTVTEKYVEEQKNALARVLDFPKTPDKDEITKTWNIQTQLGVQWCNTFVIPSRTVRITSCGITN